MWLTVGQLFGRGTCPCAPTVHTYHIITTINNLHTSNTAGEAGIAFSIVCLSICAKTEKIKRGNWLTCYVLWCATEVIRFWWHLILAVDCDSYFDILTQHSLCERSTCHSADAVTASPYLSEQGTSRWSSTYAANVLTANTDGWYTMQISAPLEQFK